MSNIPHLIQVHFSFMKGWVAQLFLVTNANDNNFDSVPLYPQVMSRNESSAIFDALTLLLSLWSSSDLSSIDVLGTFHMSSHTHILHHPGERLLRITCYSFLHNCWCIMGCRVKGACAQISILYRHPSVYSSKKIAVTNAGSSTVRSQGIQKLIELRCFRRSKVAWISVKRICWDADMYIQNILKGTSKVI